MERRFMPASRNPRNFSDSKVPGFASRDDEENEQDGKYVDDGHELEAHMLLAEALAKVRDELGPDHPDTVLFAEF